MSGIGSGQGFNRIFEGSQGMQANRMLDALGLPDQVGDLIGAQIDAQRGDIRGMMRNLSDLNSGLNTQTLDQLFGKGLPPSQAFPRPSLNPFGGLTETPMGFRPVGLNREAPFGTGFVGRSMERAINSNPFFKAQMEKTLGGQIIPDGRNDGKLSVYRPPFNHLGGILREAFGQGLPQQGIAGLLGGLNLPFGGGLMQNPLSSMILGGLQRAEANIGSFMGLPGFGPGLPFENAFGQASSLLSGLPGSIFGGPMGGLISQLQDGPPHARLLENMGQSFELLGKMMQAQASMDRFAYQILRG